MRREIIYLLSILIAFITLAQPRVKDVELYIYNDQLDSAAHALNQIVPEDLENDQLPRYYFCKGYIADEKGNLKSAYVYYNNALRTLTPGDHQRELSLRKNIAIILRKFHLYDYAREQYNAALDLVDKTSGDDDEKKASLLYNYALSYYHQQNYQEAIEYFELASRLTENDKLFMKIHNYAGLCAKYSQVYGIALSKFNDQIAYCAGKEGSFYTHKISQAHHNIAEIQNELGRYDLSEEHYLKAIQLRTDEKDLFIDYMGLGEMYLTAGRYQDAVNALTKAVEYYTEQPIHKDQIDVFLLLSKAHANDSNEEKAIHFQSIYLEKIDRLVEYQEEMRQVIAKNDMLNLIQTVNRDNQWNKREKNNELWFALILTSLILLGMAIYIWRKHRINQVRRRVENKINQLNMFES